MAAQGRRLCRFQKWRYDAGSDFMAEMDEAVRKARRTIGLLSPAYLRSDR